MNQFRLFALGEDFDTDSYLGTTTLKFDGVWRKGENGNGDPKLNGVFKDLGDGRVVSISEQENIAIEFLSAHREALRALAQHPDVTTFTLGLEYRVAVGISTMGFCLTTSPRLMWHCLDIGITANYYVFLDKKTRAKRRG